MKPRAAPASRKLILAIVAFGLFLLFDIALFGWQIFRSLSQREIEEALIETRLEAESLAEQIAGSADLVDSDLYTAFATERVADRHLGGLREREVVHSVVVYDHEGKLVYRFKAESQIPFEPGLDIALDSAEVAPGEAVREEVVKEESFTYDVPDIQVPIGNVGTLEVGIDPAALRQRIETLRVHLIKEASLIGGVSVALLLFAGFIIWLLYRRSQRLELQAAEAERMAYVGTLASGLAHEIRNPLNSLSLNMQMLDEELRAAGGGSGGRLLDITSAEIERLERLVTDFLTYARPRATEVEPVPASELLARTREVLTGAARSRGLTIEVEDATGGAELAVDRTQVGQLLLNLAYNGLAATEGGSRPPKLRLAAHRRGSTAVLEVSDNGAGIPPDDLERIFEIFYSTRKGGTGLGLAIVDRIARNHGGRVEVETEVGRGTRISVVLPDAIVGSAATLPLEPRLEGSI